MNKQILAYLAGVVDSDGSIGIRKDTYGMRVRGDQCIPNYFPRVIVSQVTPQAVALLNRTLGGMVHIQKARSPNGRALIRWEVRYESADKALKRLIPFLRIKREQALLAMRLQRFKKKPLRGYRNVKALTRWGSNAVFKRRMRSTHQLELMERMYLKMRSLNDTRSDPQFWPITDRQRNALDRLDKRGQRL